MCCCKQGLDTAKSRRKATGVSLPSQKMTQKVCNINRLIKALPVCIASISLGANIFCYKNKGLILALPTWLKQPQNCIL